MLSFILLMFMDVFMCLCVYVHILVLVHAHVCGSWSTISDVQLPNSASLADQRAPGFTSSCLPSVEITGKSCCAQLFMWMQEF